MVATSEGYGSPVARIRRGSEWAVNSTCAFAGSSCSDAETARRQVVDVGRLGRPALDAGERQSEGAGLLAGPLEVGGDGDRRVVRSEHEPDDHVDSVGGQPSDGVLDRRLGVAQPDLDHEATGAALLECCGDRRPLRLGALVSGLSPPMAS